MKLILILIQPIILPALNSQKILTVHNKFLSDDTSTLFTDKDIIVLSETHFGVRSKSPENYTLIGRSQPRLGKKYHGGVAVYKHNTCLVSFNTLSDSFTDMVVLEIQDSDILLIALYIPPYNSTYYTDLFFDNLKMMINNFISIKSIVVFGDMNARIRNDFTHKGTDYIANPDML